MSLKDISQEFNAQSAAKILKEVVEEFEKENLFQPEPYRFFLKEGFDSASWGYRPPHYVIIGTDIFKHFTAKDTQKSEYFKMFVIHEIAHSIYTDYKIFKVIKILEERDLPFNVFNLFEDARIEHKIISENSIKSIEDFNWSKFMQLDTPYDSLDLFYWIVQKSGDKKRFDSIYKLLNLDLKNDAPRVWAFYEKTINAKDTYEVIDIVEEWMNKMQDETLNIGVNLFKAEIEILNAPDSIIEQQKGAFEIISISIKDLKSKQIAANVGPTIANSDSIKRLSTQNLLAKETQRGEFDKVLIQKIIKYIEHIFVDEKRYIKTPTPAKRLNLRALLLNTTNKYKKKKAITQQKRKVTVILDISGSMSGVIEEMLLLIEVFNILAKKGLVEGYLILSVSQYIEEAAYQTFKFPLKEGLLKKIVTYKGTEGLAEVMKYLKPILKPNDFVLVFTDGVLADDPLDKLFFYRHKIDLYGVYLSGINNHGHDLKRYFDNYIVDDNLENIAYKMVDLLEK